MRTAGLGRCSACWLILIGCASVLASLPCLIARAGNIFDDNWAPPKPTVPAATPSGNPGSPAPTPLPPRPVTRTPPRETPSEAPASVAPPTAAIVIRKPIPGKGDLTRSRTTLKEVFAAPMRDSSLAGRRKLAEQLFDLVTKTSDNPVDQYVLLAATINAAKEGANLRLCLQAADLMSQLFEVDGLALKTESALSMPLKAEAPADNTENLRAAMSLVDTLVARDDLASAARLCGLLKPVAAADPFFRAVVQKRGGEFDQLRVERDRFARQMELLKTTPNDPNANLGVGRYYCFVRGMWDTGLPYLARGADVDLKKAAVTEMEGAKTPEAQESLGDRWWSLADKQPESARGNVREHAALFYAQAVGSATGLGRVKMDERIAQAAAAAKSVLGVALPGLSAEYFADGTFKKVLKTQVDAQVDFKWPNGIAPETGMPTPRYSIRWKGYIVIPASGATAIRLEADDGARVLIDDQVVMDYSKPTKGIASANWTPGPHALEINYFNTIAGGHARLSWILTGESAETVPANALVHLPSAKTTP